MSSGPADAAATGGRAAGAGARLLTVMGSGETAPTMVKIHRAILARLGPAPVPAVLLDTPFGFQENAAELARRVVGYFAESLQAPIEVASLPMEELDALDERREGGAVAASEEVPLRSTDKPRFGDERLVSAIRAARYVFAGPGSPTYALRRWRDTVVPALLREKLRHGGGISFSSAAALTLGLVTVPVYEIYKVGDDPHWLEGLDLLAEAGLRAAVIPHFNNAEGGTHDTRFCYLGERRLSLMESELPEGAFVLGVDEHTSVTFDLDESTASVGGIGVVSVRASGRTRTIGGGEVVAVGALLEMAETLRRSKTGSANRVGSRSAGTDTAGGTLTREPGSREDSSSPKGAGPRVLQSGVSPLVAVVREEEGAFADAVGRRDAPGAVEALLELEAQVTAWSRDFPAGDELDRARASVRSLVVELGRLAELGTKDPREAVAPFVGALLELRARARADRRFGEADWIRDRLGGLGIEVRDRADATDWLLA